MCHSAAKFQENSRTKRALPRTLNTKGQFLNCPRESWTVGMLKLHVVGRFDFDAHFTVVKVMQSVRCVWLCATYTITVKQNDL